ncbi:type II toxin-antitoxin system HipA family toxin [Thiohalorhabdus methylotrophus]|uniref:Type II toxin-antitoxin system HipA family toxin n=1 Tax=Thiohalorhabdus methylotrophus TaxID=3242694 RepID=A0ABV4TUN4_9GAMM
MPRRPRYEPLRVLLNNRPVGHLTKRPGGEIRFGYDPAWLEWKYAFPVSLSLPLREDPYRGEPVSAVFDNLLPDAQVLRHRVAERVGAAGTDAYSLLAAIGRDCVGALQFAPGEEREAVGPDSTMIHGEAVDGEAIERLLQGLAQAPLGLGREDPFRISVAGAQEKTALLWDGGQWLRPHGTTPTTHILKPQIGTLPYGMDLSNSVENEFYCLKMAEAFGLPVNHAEIRTFGSTKALVVERFDRQWTRDGRLLRVPQEDCCQALSVPPTRKYQNEGGPGLVDVLGLLRGSDQPHADQATVLKAQTLFWLLGATDGHAKNFSVFLAPGGSYRLTPLYDVVSVQPSLESGQIQPEHMRLAMSVGARRHYKVHEVLGRHFAQSGQEAGLPERLVHDALEEMAGRAREAVERVEAELPAGFPEEIHESVKRGMLDRIRRLERE